MLSENDATQEIPQPVRFHFTHVQLYGWTGNLYHDGIHLASSSESEHRIARVDPRRISRGGGSDVLRKVRVPLPLRGRRLRLSKGSVFADRSVCKRMVIFIDQLFRLDLLICISIF